MTGMPVPAIFPAAEDAPLAQALRALAVHGILVGHRLIRDDDAGALLPEELAPLARAVAKVRRQSGAARIIARELLAAMGHGRRALPRGASGAVRWPHGIVGSLAHDDRVALAAVAHHHDVALLGIDVEPSRPLPPPLAALIATPQERAIIEAHPLAGRLLFVLKEAVFKAVHPLDGIFLEHRDIEIDVPERKGTACYGRTVDLRFCLSGHIVGLAFSRNHLKEAETP